MSRWANKSVNHPGLEHERRRFSWPAKTDELQPVDGNAWATYTAAGRDQFAGVSRSWTVFRRNAVDPLGVIDAVETDPIASLKFMNAMAGNVGSDHEDEQLRRAFWEAVDQHLHNLLASAGQFS